MERDKFVPYDKMSKKERKKLNAQKRKDWGNVNPTTRIEKSKNEYQRHPKHKKSDLDDNC